MQHRVVSHGAGRGGWPALLLVAVVSTAGAVEPAPLLVASVVDDATGAPIREFTTVPGVNPLDGIDWQWQPHKVHTYRGRALRYPPAGERAYREEQVLLIEAPGYVATRSPVIMPTALEPGERPDAVVRPGRSAAETLRAVWPRPDAPATITIRMRRDPGVSGVVVDSVGEPVVGATIAAGMSQYRRPRFHNGRVWRRNADTLSDRDRWEQPHFTESGAGGRFALPTLEAGATVLASHAAGVAVLRFDELAADPTIRLRPLGRIEGQAIWNGKPAAGARLRLAAQSQSAAATTDEQGRFAFQDVPPGPATVSRVSSRPGDNSVICTNPVGHLTVAAGGATRCVLGGRGRPVVGRVTGFDDWQDVSVSVHLDVSWPPYSGLVGGFDKVYGAFAT